MIGWALRPPLGYSTAAAAATLNGGLLATEANDDVDSARRVAERPSGKRRREGR